jgi:hypothetical protein
LVLKICHPVPAGHAGDVQLPAHPVTHPAALLNPSTSVHSVE